MSYQLQTPTPETVQVLETKNFDAVSVTCVHFTFSEDAGTMEFVLRWQNADKTLKREKSYLITGEDLQTILVANAATMLSLRAAIFNYAKQLGDLGDGVDLWGQN